MPDVIGQTQIVNLEINKGYTLSFDLEWFDEADNAVAISGIDARLTIGDVFYDLDALGYATFQANVVSIVLPSGFTAAMPNRPGKWRCGATDANSGESPLLVKGAVRLIP